MAVLTPITLSTMANIGYKSMTIQCGSDADAANERLRSLDRTYGIDIDIIPYTDTPKYEILKCRGLQAMRPAGVVISHAGMTFRHTCKTHQHGMH
jgi:hypothetical protein